MNTPSIGIDKSRRDVEKSPLPAIVRLSLPIPLSTRSHLKFEIKDLMPLAGKTESWSSPARSMNALSSGSVLGSFPTIPFHSFEMRHPIFNKRILLMRSMYLLVVLKYTAANPKKQMPVSKKWHFHSPVPYRCEPSEFASGLLTPFPIARAPTLPIMLQNLYWQS